MSPTASKKRRTGTSHRAPDTQRGTDLGPYVGFALIWLFASFIVYLTTDNFGPIFSSGLLAAFFVYVALVTAQAARGVKLPVWKRGLVRLPLILAGARKTAVPSMADAPVGRHATIIAALIALLAVGLTVAVAVRTL